MINGKPLTTGGSGGLTPQIVVNSITGSTISCDGVEGTEVSGTWTFKTTIGTHTIVGQYNGKTQSKTVVVDAVGLYEVEIDYKLWLYKLGDECDDVTGGWTSQKSGYNFCLYHINSIDMSGYSTANIEYETYDVSDTYNGEFATSTTQKAFTEMTGYQWIRSTSTTLSIPIQSGATYINIYYPHPVNWGDSVTKNTSNIDITGRYNSSYHYGYRLKKIWLE